MFLVSWSWPGSSELNEQRSRALQVNLIDRVVFVRILVVPTTSSADSLPLAVNLRTDAETQTWIFNIKLHTHTHTHTQTYNVWRCVDKIPVWFEWKDLGSWRRWTCIRSKPVKANRTWSLWKNRSMIPPAENKSSKNKRQMYSEI